MRRGLLGLMLLTPAVLAAYWPAVGFSFLNWDDHLVIVENAALAQPGVAPWAFTTTYMEHYQPVSWLAWALVRGSGAPDPQVFHTMNLVLHVLATLLVWAVASRLLAPGAWAQSPLASGHEGPSSSLGLSGGAAHAAAIGAALVYGLHPLRVEVVAWVSAMPYALATVFALGAMWTWLRASERHSGVPWLVVVIFALSLLARPVALGLPLVLMAVDFWVCRRPARSSLLRAVPLLVLAFGFAAAEFVARAPGVADVPWPYRLQLVTSAPFVYLWRTLVPVDLTPLDVLPLDPAGNPLVIIGALAGHAAVTAAAWRRPAAMAAWVSYLALLAPAAGLVPSGLQATADRYTYLPGIVIAVVLAGAIASWADRRLPRARLGLAALILVAMASAAASRALLPHWADSVSLWTRAVTVDPRNDMAQYNLGAALAARGESAAAAERYRAVLAINPAHSDARARLDAVDAARLEREGNDLASAGRLAEAAARYHEALARDPGRPHAHAARGMALASIGRTAEAIPHLREALKLGVGDVAIPNTLAGLLMEAGEAREARAVLEGAMAVHQNDPGLALNLARLLVTLPGLPPPDRMRGFRLAEAVAQATGGRDARVLDTLAAALAAIGRLPDARAINARAAALAAAEGDQELAVQITARGRAYR